MGWKEDIQVVLHRQKFCGLINGYKRKIEHLTKYTERQT